MLLMGTRWRDSLHDCNTQARNAGVPHQAVHTQAAEGTFQAGSACQPCRLPSTTLPENPMFPLPNMAPCVRNTWEQPRTRKSPSLHSQARVQGTQGESVATSSSPCSGHPDTSTGHQCGNHTAHMHTPFWCTLLLDSIGSPNSLTSKLCVSIYSKTRKNCEILVQNGGWLGKIRIMIYLPLEVSSPSYYSTTMLKWGSQNILAWQHYTDDTGGKWKFSNI